MHWLILFFALGVMCGRGRTISLAEAKRIVREAGYLLMTPVTKETP